MNLEENIRIAAEVYATSKTELGSLTEASKYNSFIDGAKSQAAKDYWYNEFKRQKIQYDSGQDQSLRNQPLKPSECFHGKSTLEANYATVQKDGDRHVTIVIPDLTKLDGVPEEYQRAKQYQQYIDEHPDRPISFDNWKYMVEHYEKPGLLSKHDIDDVVNGKRPHYPYGTIQSDPLYGATKKDFDDATPEHIGIIGHVDHGKTLMVGLGLCESQKGLIIMDMDTPLTPEERFEIMKNLKPDLSAIKSIVPIADVIPEEIISKQEFLEMHDKAVERSITEETYKESRAWDIKKEKKVSHKRNNKRK